MDDPRPRHRRIADARRRFDDDLDCWVATAGTTGPWLVPLTFAWDGRRFLLATSALGRVVRDLGAMPRLRLAFGHTRDVVMVEATATLHGWDDPEVVALADGR